MKCVNHKQHYQSFGKNLKKINDGNIEILLFLPQKDNMKSIVYIILMLLLLSAEVTNAQNDSIEHKKIVTGWSVGMTLFDLGTNELQNLSTFYGAAEFYNRFYVGICGTPFFGDGIMYEDFSDDINDYPRYSIYGRSFGTYFRPCFNLKKLPIRVSTPVFFSCINIEIKKENWLSKNEASFLTWTNKRSFGIRPGLMIEINVMRRVHPFVMYSYEICFCRDLYDKQNGQIIYNKNFNAHWLTILGTCWGNYYKNPKIRTCKL